MTERWSPQTVLFLDFFFFFFFLFSCIFSAALVIWWVTVEALHHHHRLFILVPLVLTVFCCCCCCCSTFASLSLSLSNIVWKCLSLCLLFTGVSICAVILLYLIWIEQKIGDDEHKAFAVLRLLLLWVCKNWKLKVSLTFCTFFPRINSCRWAIKRFHWTLIYTLFVILNNICWAIV